MDVDEISIAGLIASITLIAIFGIIITQNGFPAFEQPTLNQRLIATTQPIGQKVSTFMWAYRSADIITQAFVLFAAAAGCLAILRVEEERKSEAK